MLLVIAVAAQIAALTDQPNTAPAATGQATDPRSPAGFDIAGIRLQMTPTAVKTALASRSYRVTEVRPIMSFAQSARQEAARRKTDKSRQERLVVDFAQHPEGARVASVAVRINVEVQTAESFSSRRSRNAVGRRANPTA